MNESLPAGLIRHYGLTDWWMNTFTAEEREKISFTFDPLYVPPYMLTIGDWRSVSGSATQLLSSLAGWFKKSEERMIAYRIIEQAEVLSPQAEVLDRHFMYQSKIQTYYPNRDRDNFALSKAIEGCEQQIAMGSEAAHAFTEKYGEGLPAHVGYQQLAIILEKQGKLKEAIKLCQQALKQGWAGDWTARIDRYKKKLEKLNG